MADDPPKKESTEDILARGFAPQPKPGKTIEAPPLPSAAETRGKGGEPTPKQVYQEEVPKITIPGREGTVPLQGEKQWLASHPWLDPVARAGTEAAALTAIGTMAPPLAGAGLARLLPGIMKGMRPLAQPSLTEVGTGALNAGAWSAGTEWLDQATGRNAVISPVSDALAMAGPLLTSKVGGTVAPRVTPQTAKTAREAERLGLSLTPKQVAETQPSGFGAHEPHNNYILNRLMSGAADDTPVARIERPWLAKVGNKLDQAYEYIFSPQNIFTAGPQQDQVVNMVMSGQALKSAEVDKFINEASNRVPYLTESALLPVRGGYQVNPKFLPPDGPQLREARDMIRKLQRSKEPAVRHYGNEVWDEAMNHLMVADPHVQQQLQLTNGRYRTWKMLEDMNEDGRLVQGNVDPKWLDDRHSSGWGKKKYLRGQDDSVPAKLGLFSRDLRMLNEPPAAAKSHVPEALVVGTAGLAGGAVPIMMNKGEISYPDILKGAILASGASYPARKAIVSGIRGAANPVGRAIQKMPRTQQDDLATRGKWLQRMLEQRPGASSLLGKLNVDTYEESRGDK